MNWKTKVISVPKADTTLVDAGPPELRDYDVFEKLWKELKGLEDDEAGAPFVDAQRHSTTTTVGGVTLAHVVEIINGYTVTFENGSYQVTCKGANHNVLDRSNMNTVALRSANSAGLIVAGSGVTAQDKLDIADQVLNEALSEHVTAGTMGKAVGDINTKTSTLPSGIQKNAALANFQCLLVSSTDHVTPKTGLTVAGQVSQDGGAFANLTNSVVEMANGMYRVNLTAAEMNADILTLRFTATGADPRLVTIVTEP